MNTDSPEKIKVSAVTITTALFLSLNEQYRKMFANIHAIKKFSEVAEREGKIRNSRYSYYLTFDDIRAMMDSNKETFHYIPDTELIQLNHNIKADQLAERYFNHQSREVQELLHATADKFIRQVSAVEDVNPEIELGR
ncbi:hypothetical protein ACTNEN_08375 [Oribacterium sp. HCP28S3_H8]|jgi:DNA phosphorothioation-dependent restriction protein DptG|uniref:hypothetical protein n=1 Tax=Oribacterium sp. HCP28S3_H8 TaxID=3438945 RepID=UPI00302ACBFD|nr:hypothetical protein [Oribacterium sp.]